MKPLVSIVVLLVGLSVICSEPMKMAPRADSRASTVRYERASRVPRHPRSHHRSRAVTEDFEREHPCPSTGKTTGACPGYIKDHIRALCVGGPDAVSNLQWQTVTDAKAKDKWECKTP